MEDDDKRRRTVMHHILCHRTGIRLTESARKWAAEAALDYWVEGVYVGDAVEQGIRIVTWDVLAEI